MENWFLHPTKRSLFYISFLWVVGFIMTAIVSDFFKNANLLIGMMVFSSAMVVAGMYLRYYSKRKKTGTTGE